MRKEKCPHCNERTVTFIQKSMIGPYKHQSEPCKKCGKEITVSCKRYNLVFMPSMFFTIYGALYIKSALTSFTFLPFIVAVVIMMLAHHYLVPLKAKDQ